MLRNKRTVFWLTLLLPALFVVGCAVFTIRHMQQERRDRSLLVGIWESDTSTALRMLQDGADPNARLDLTVPPKGLLGQLRAALGLGARQRNGRSALTLAVLRDNTTLVRALLDHGARDVNTALPPGNGLTRREFGTLLMIACANRNPEIAEALLDRGANPNARNGDGQTAAFLAVNSRYCLPILIAHGADLGVRDNYGNTLLLWAASSEGKALPTLLECLPRPTNVNARNRDGTTALLAACFQGSVENVRLLLERGADPTLINNAGRTGWSYAQTMWSRAPEFPSADNPPNGLEIIRLLKKYGAKR